MNRDLKISEGLRLKSKPPSGMTLIEVMVALTILLPSLMGLGAAMWKRQQVTVKIRGVNQMVAVQSALMQSISSEASYTDAQLTSMRNGSWPAGGVNIVLNSETFSGAITIPVNAGVGGAHTTRCIDSDGVICNCAGFGANCPVQFEVQAREITPAIGPKQYQYAYRVTGHESLGKMPPLGAPTRPGGGFETAPSSRDFSHFVPEKIYRFSVNRFCSGNNVALAGLVKDTGQEICLRAASSINSPGACPSGSLPKQFISTGGVLSFRCLPLATVSCNDTHFVLQVLNPSSFDSGGNKGQCRMVTRQAASYSTLGSGINTGSITGEVCPPYYISQSTCTVVETKNIDGACPTWNIEYVGTSAQAVAGGTNYYRDYAPVYAGTVTENARPGTAVFTQSGRNVTRCELVIPPNRCGAIWEGRVQLTPSCVLEAGYQAQRPGS